MSENKMIVWRGQVLGNLNDDPRLLARRMMELDANDAISTTADFIEMDYGDEAMHIFIERAIRGKLNGFDPEDFVADMFSYIIDYWEDYGDRLDPLGIEIIDVGSSPNMRSAATGARGSRPRGRWLR